MKLKISRILHAGYVFQYEKTQIIFDPIFENPFSRNCYAYPDVEFDHQQIKNLKPDAIFISHFHDDHCSLDSLNFLNRKTPIYVYCVFEELFAMIRELGFLNVHPLTIDVGIKVGNFEIIPRKALDSDVDSMFQIIADDLNILNVVDSWIDPETLEQLSQYSPWDLILWPFQTMREIQVLAPSRADTAANALPEEWVDQLKKLDPRYVVPSSCQFIQESWSWYNLALFPISYRQFKEDIESALSTCQVIRLNPSLSITLDKGSLEFSSPLTWVLPRGEQDVDYLFKKDLKPPPTAEVSRQFSPVSVQQSEQVFSYCRQGLLEKYRTMEIPLDPYFNTPRHWQLSVYDHHGEGSHFRYHLNGRRIDMAEENEGPVSWLTEIPIAKFFGAIEFGESLTSLYMRINDFVFDEDIEKEIQSADIVDDPLIRCLFHGVFGSYQLAQLKRLKAARQNLIP